MTLTQIERAANRGNIATGNFDIGHVLRFEVIPEFYRKVGEADATWLRRSSTLAVAINGREYDLPPDFRSMVEVYQAGLTANGKPTGMKYIGEDPLLVAQSEITTETGTPDGWYIVLSGAKKWRSIRFNRPFSESGTIPYVYRSRIVFGDDSDEVELDEYIPEELQPTLIEGVRREIYLDRYSMADTRFAEASRRFDEGCLIAQQFHDHARRNKAYYID